MNSVVKRMAALLLTVLMIATTGFAALAEEPSTGTDLPVSGSSLAPSAPEPTDSPPPSDPPADDPLPTPTPAQPPTPAPTGVPITADGHPPQAPDAPVVMAAETDIVPVTVTVDGGETRGGTFADGAAVEVAFAAGYAGPATQLKYTTDGSDPADETDLYADISFTLDEYTHLCVLATNDDGSEDYPTGVDYLLAPGTGINQAQTLDMHYWYPDSFQEAPEITNGTYRFDTGNTGVTDDQGAWGVIDYPDTGAIASHTRSAPSLLAYQPNGSTYSQAKTDRMMLCPNPTTSGHYALSFWLWQDVASFYPDASASGVTFTIDGPNGYKMDTPLFFTAQASAPGWQQYFIDLTGHIPTDGYGLQRFGFTVSGYGAQPLYVDDVGIVDMKLPPTTVAVPESASAKKTLYLGDVFNIGQPGEGFVWSAQGTDTGFATPVMVSEDAVGNAPWDFDASPLQVAGGAEQWLVARPQNQQSDPTEVGAFSFYKMPHLTCREPILCFAENPADIPQEVGDAGADNMYEQPRGVWLSLYTYDYQHGADETDIEIWYTLDGSSVLDANGSPTGEATLYDGSPFEYDGSEMVVQAAAVNPAATWNSSTTGFWRLNLPRAAQVTASIPSGTVQPGDEITLACATPGAQIYYSTTGATPTRALPGTLYTGPIEIQEDTVLTAVAWSADTSESQAATFRYALPGDGDIFEPNNTVVQASPLSFPFQIEATLHDEGDLDYYAFHFPGGRMELKLIQPDTRQAQDTPYEVILLNTLGNEVATGESTPNRVIAAEIAEGDYYVLVWRGNGVSAASYSQKPYTLSVSRLATEGLNFSEMNLVTAMNHPDAPGAYNMGKGLDSGGTEQMSTAYLARWSGPVLEEQDPYTVVKIPDPSDPDGTIFDNETMAYHTIAPQYHLGRAVWLTDPTRDEIKRAVYTHGGLHISYIHDEAAMPGYRPEYYYPPALKDELGYDAHAVTLVGWDDSYPKESFTITHNGVDYTPQGDGAYIFKNSWGTSSMGEDGYFYASYYSYMFPYRAAYYVLESDVNYNSVYQYDLLGVTGWKALIGHENQNYVYLRNDFTAAAGEVLRAVGFYTSDDRQQYDVYIEQAGERQHVAGGLMPEPGYHTLRLPQDVPLAAGQTFSIIVRLESTGDAPISVPAEYLIHGQSEKVNLQTGCTFLSVDGETWQDFTAAPYRANACVKAFGYDPALPTGSVAYHGAAMPDVSDTYPTRPPLVDDPNTQADNTGLGSIDSPLENMPTSDFPVPNLALPARFDLREVGAVTPVENQGNLGSCWTFGTLGSAESIFMRSGNIAYAYPATVSLPRANLTLDIAQGVQPLALSATVRAPDAIGTNLVYWSFAGDVGAIEVEAYITNSGQQANLLKAVGTGTVTVTATSAADTSKSASMELAIVDTSTIPGLEGAALVSLPPFAPQNGQLDDEQLALILETIAALQDGQALVLRFTADVTVPKAVFDALKERGAKIALCLVDLAGASRGSFVFDGAQMPTPCDFLLGFVLQASGGGEAQAGTAFAAGTLMQPITFLHSGPLPGPATVSFPQSHTPFVGTSGSLHYYRYENGGFTAQSGVNAKFENGLVQLAGLTHCSEYLLANAALLASDGSPAPAPAPIAALGSSPRTGDTARPGLALGVTLVAFTGLGLLLRARRRQKHPAKK